MTVSMDTYLERVLKATKPGVVTDEITVDEPTWLTAIAVCARRARLVVRIPERDPVVIDPAERLAEIKRLQRKIDRTAADIEEIVVRELSREMHARCILSISDPRVRGMLRAIARNVATEAAGLDRARTA